MKKYPSVLTTAAATLLTLSATPALANDNPTKPHGGALAWYNDSGHWGYLTSPTQAECHTLNPALSKGGVIANFTRYKATFYPEEGCIGIAGPVIGPHDIISGVENSARSVILIPDNAIPTQPSNEPGPTWGPILAGSRIQLSPVPGGTQPLGDRAWSPRAYRQGPTRP